MKSPLSRQASPAYSLGRPSPFLSPTPAPAPSLPHSSLQSPILPSPRHRTSAISQEQHSSPPQRRAISSDSSDHEVELVSARKSSPALSACSASPPAMLQDTGRSLRNRTAAQLNPYSIEQAKYTRTLLRNGWQGAVVAGPRRGEETAEELHRKKVAAALAPKDDLDGWLEYEEGQPVARGRAPSLPPAELSDDSVDGEDLLEREARRRDKMARQVEAAFQGGKRGNDDRGEFFLIHLSRSSLTRRAQLLRETSPALIAHHGRSSPEGFQPRPSGVARTSRRIEPAPQRATATRDSRASPLAALRAPRANHRHPPQAHIMTTSLLASARLPLHPKRSIHARSLIAAIWMLGS